MYGLINSEVVTYLTKSECREDVRVFYLENTTFGKKTNTCIAEVVKEKNGLILDETHCLIIQLLDRNHGTGSS